VVRMLKPGPAVEDVREGDVCLVQANYRLRGFGYGSLDIRRRSEYRCRAERRGCRGAAGGSLASFHGHTPVDGGSARIVQQTSSANEAPLVCAREAEGAR
jgi:hypothetical protein